MREFISAEIELRLPSPLNIPVIVAGSFLCIVMGTVHAFSVFLEPLETAFESGRANVSLIYSTALLSITVSVLFGHRLYARFSPATLVATICLLGMAGTQVAGQADSIWSVWLGYGLIFGLANGLGYGFSLQISALASPGREGLAMGIITASYALGAAAAPPILTWTQVRFGFGGSMNFLSILLLVALPVSFLLIKRSGVSYSAASGNLPSKTADPVRELAMWLAYGAGVVAGLMVIGHAVGIVQSFHSQIPVWIAPILIAIFNLGGSLTGGALIDRFGARRSLPYLPGLTVLGLLALLMFPSSTGIFVGLALTGFAYGALIAAYPAAIAKTFGVGAGVQIYGRIFTAWGCAGLLGPWLAGWLFDCWADYTFALIVAIGFSLVSLATIYFPFRKR